MAEQRADQVLVLGDLVGYGASPGAVIDVVQREGWPCTLGSSDARVAMALGDSGGRRGVAEQTLAWTKQMLTPGQYDFLRKLPTSGRIQTKVGRLRYFHGSPHNPEERLDLMADDRKLDEVLQSLNAKIIVCGGTHIPMYRRTDEGLLIDPGSVGLSLNNEPGADIAIVDDSERRVKVELHKVPYDYHSAAFDIMAWNLPPVIADVIRSGRMGA